MGSTSQQNVSDRGEIGVEHGTRPPVFRQPVVFRLLVTALIAEIGYAVLNIGTMPVYLRNERHFGTGTIGLVLVAFLLSEAIFKSPMGHFADKHGRRKLMILGPSISIATSLLSFVVPHGSSFETLAFIVLRIGDGIGAAMLWPAMFAAMGDSVCDEDRQSALSLLNLCYILGVALALPVGGIVNDLAREPGASLVLAAIAFAGVSLAAAFAIPNNISKPAPAADSGEHSAGLSEILEATKSIPEYLVIAVVVFFGIGLPTSIIKLFAQDVLQMSESKFGGLVFPGAIAMGVLSMPLSRYGERIGRHKAVHIGLLMSSLGLAIISSGMFVPWLRQSWVLALGGIPAGLGFLLTLPSWLASVSDVNPEKRGANLGAVMTAQGVGMILGAPIGGQMYEMLQPVGKTLNLGADFGRYSPFAGTTVMLLAAWVLSVRIFRA